MIVVPRLHPLGAACQRLPTVQRCDSGGNHGAVAAAIVGRLYSLPVNLVHHCGHLPLDARWQCVAVITESPDRRDRSTAATLPSLTKPTAPELKDGGDQEAVTTKPFGWCCAELDDAMTQPPNSAFSVDETGVLYLAVGCMETEEGPGWLDQAVLFCPFCGTSLQTRDGVVRRSLGTTIQQNRQA